MSLPDYSINWSAVLASGTTCAVGDVLIINSSDGTSYVVATSANRGTRGSECVALSAFSGSGIGSVRVSQNGMIPASISGLSAGAKALVKCSTTGRIERVVGSPTTSDDLIGMAEADGRVHLHFGYGVSSISAAAGVPGGSNKQLQYNSSGVFAGTSEFTYEGSGKLQVVGGYLAYGAGTLPTTGAHRMPYDGAPPASVPWLTYRSSAGVTKAVIATQGDAIILGDFNLGIVLAIGGSNVQYVAALEQNFGSASNYWFTNDITNGTNLLGRTTFGDSRENSPYALSGAGTFAVTDSAGAQNFANTVYRYRTIILTGALTSARTIGGLPHPASAATAYEKTIDNRCTGADAVVSTGSGTTATIPFGTTVDVCVNTTGVKLKTVVLAPGSDTQVLFNDATFVGADAGFTYNKTTDVVTVATAVAIGGGTPSASGIIRGKDNQGTVMAFRNTGNTNDLNALATSASELFVGTDVSFTAAKQFAGLRSYFGSYQYFGIGNTFYFGLQASKILCSQTVELSQATTPAIFQGTRFRITSVIGEVQTSSTAATTVTSYAMSDDTHCQFDAIVTFASRTAVTKAGTYKLSVGYRRTAAGAPTIVGALVTQTEQETTAGDTVTIDVSSNDVRVRVTAADTDGRNWSCELRVQETLDT